MVSIIKRNTYIVVIVISIVILIICSFIGSYFSVRRNDETYENINWVDEDVSGVTDMSNVTLNPWTIEDVTIPSNEELDKTLWNKNKINIDVQYHDDPTEIANSYSVPFGSNIVYDNSGNKILLKTVATMAPPVYYDPSNEIYNPTSFVPSYSDSILLRQPI